MAKQKKKIDTRSNKSIKDETFRNSKEQKKRQGNDRLYDQNKTHNYII